MDDYVGVGDMTPHAKNGKKSSPQGQPDKGVKCEGKMRLFFNLFKIFL